MKLMNKIFIMENDGIGTGSTNGLMDFLTELGKALTASGISVVDITSILEKIAKGYGEKAEILVFPTMILIKIGEQESSPINAANSKTRTFTIKSSFRNI